jgi:hypothetical protein
MVRTRIKGRRLALCAVLICVLGLGLYIASGWGWINYTRFLGNTGYWFSLGYSSIGLCEVPAMTMRRRNLISALEERYEHEAWSWKLQETLRRLLTTDGPAPGREYDELVEDIKRDVESEAAVRYPRLGTAELLARFPEDAATLAPRWWFDAGHGPAFLWLPRVSPRDASGNGMLIRIPLWIPLVLMLAGTALLLWRTRSSPPAGHCQTCGYDLTGNVSGRCPECGVQVHPVSERG